MLQSNGQEVLGAHFNALFQSLDMYCSDTLTRKPKTMVPRLQPDRKLQTCSIIYFNHSLNSPTPVAEWSRTWRVCGRSLAGIAGSNPAGGWMSVSCECCLLSGKGLCDGPIPRPEESFFLWCVIMCDQEISSTRRPWPASGSCDGNK
jgi:hypothetical protein